MLLDFWCENRGGSLTSYSPVDVHLAQASAFSHILYLLTIRGRLIMNFVCHLLITSCRNTRGSNCITSVIKDIDHTGGFVSDLSWKDKTSSAIHHTWCATLYPCCMPDIDRSQVLRQMTLRISPLWCKHITARDTRMQNITRLSCDRIIYTTDNWHSTCHLSWAQHHHICQF